MIRNSIKIGFQRLLAFKAYSLINVSGLAIAISVCLAIFFYAYYHFSFDKYIPDSKDSYRLITRVGDGSYNVNTFTAFEDVLSDCPEIKSYTLAYAQHNVDEVIVGDQRISVKEAIFVNESFLDYFSIKMIKGVRSSINQPNTMVLTPEMAEKLFPKENAIGQSVYLRSFTANQDSLIAYTVSGIAEALPQASHIQYEILLSQKGHFEPTTEILKSRKVFGGLLYVKLFPSANVLELEKKLSTLIETKLNSAFGPPLEAFNYRLQPVCDIHFTPGLVAEKQTTVRRSTLNILCLVGFLILALATMNFVIMYIARASFYQRSILITRFFGGTKMHLFSQTIIEVIISVCISFFIAFALLAISQIYLAEQFFSGLNISFQNPVFWIITFSLFFIVNLAVSLLTSLNLLKKGSILQQTVQSKRFNAAILLVVFQFTMVIDLIGFTLLINRQMNFIDNKDLGYKSENVLVIHVPQSNTKVHILKEELAKLNGINSTGTAHHYPGYRLQDANLTIGEIPFSFKFGFIDQEAIQTLGITPIKYFTEAKEKAINGWMINETFYNNLRAHFSEEQIATGNFPKDVNQSDNDARENFVILGVMSDFHYASLHSQIENFTFNIPLPETRNNRFVLARFEQNRGLELLAEVEEKIGEVYPGQPIKYSFLDEQLHRQYNSEQTLLKLINAFSLLAILVACFGLVGLSIFITEKRTKEIGVRKVNGSSVLEIVKLLNIDFLKWIALAFVLATPLSFYATQKWLESFAYKTTLSWWIFILAGIIAIVIAFITVSWQTFKAARKNPVEALRYE